MEELSDKDIAERLRKENYEQYKQLVRMHLSFELDLNTDEFDLPCHEVIYYEKGKIKKWNRLTKKIKSCTSSKNGSGSPIDGCFIQLTKDLIEQLRHLKDFLLKEVNLKQEGIFRRTGAVSRQNELRNLINLHKEFDLNENYTVHDCATVYKGFLADLPEPLLTDAHYPAHCQIADLCNGVEIKDKKILNTNKENHILSSMQLLVLLLPTENRILLEDIIGMLYEAVKYEKFNKMSPDTLATLFSPHLICPRNLPPEALHYVSQRMSSVISYMIFKGNVLFEIPSKLATDIRAYFLEIKRKKTMSPDHTLDESISDISTVNTVYTFVDREKTAAEHNSNPTDTALAQLYAHIQSMPESSKKRKLIKQFNKENGQGTPLQMLMVNRIKNNEVQRSGGKSFSEAIKKHIFHKGLISRTPKRLNSSNTSNNNNCTPNGNLKTPRSRILFPCQILSNSNIHINQQQCNKSSTTNCGTSSKTKAIQLEHPLQKSISASSILSSTSSLSSGSTSSLNVTSTSELFIKTKSMSVPLSQTNSSEFEQNLEILNSSKEAKYKNVTNTYNDCKDTEIQWLNNKNYIDDIDFNSDEEYNDEIPINSSLDKFLTPIQNRRNVNSSLSKFKSEPNLFNLSDQEGLKKENDSHNYSDNNGKDDGKIMDYIFPKNIKNKLIKAVSLGSLMGNFSSVTQNSSRADKSKIISRSISNKSIYCNKKLTNIINNETLDSFKDCLSTIQSESELDIDLDQPDINCVYKSKIENGNHNYIEKNISDKKIYSEAVEIEDEGELNAKIYSKLLNENFVGSSQNLNVYRNIDLITSTPSQFFRKRSMSPITKSTHRMPKAMQESIMTPRSRKPVMLMATNLASSSHEQNQNTLQSDSFNFNDENGSSYLNGYNISDRDLTSVITNQPQILIKYRNEQVQNNFFVGHSEMEPKSIAEAANITNRDDQILNLNNLNRKASLSNTFREYLLSRSVLTASPVDSSFSSQPDDFGSTPEIQDLNESQMSSSLLYCLDGNKPINENSNSSNDDSNENTSCQNLEFESSNCDNNKHNVIDDGINRKNKNNLISKENISKNQQRKRNCNSLIGNDNITSYPDDIYNTRKLLIIEENPNETSL